MNIIRLYGNEIHFKHKTLICGRIIIYSLAHTLKNTILCVESYRFKIEYSDVATICILKVSLIQIRPNSA
jgi:hypothetical protein